MKKLIISTVAATVLSTSALAHFQMLYTPNTALTKGATIELKHVFTHPFADEHTMDMGKQHDTKKLSPFKEFYVINKGKKTDLKSSLKQIKFQGTTNSANAYESKYKARRMGDHVLVMKPAPYFEANEDAYIQQITKTVVNVAGAPTDWDAEIEVEYLNRDVDLKNNKMGSSRYEAPQDSFITMGIKANKDGEFTFAIPKAGFWGFCALGSGPDK